MPEFKPILTTAGINGFNGYRLDGEHPDDYTGRSTSGAGDVNGDGYADLLLGAPYAHFPAIDQGMAYIAFGGPSAPAAQNLTAALAAGNAYRFIAERAFDLAGYSLKSAGDINGDDLDDVLIGARTAGPDGGTQRGVVYLLFGGMAHFEALDLADGVNDNSASLTNLTAVHGYRFDGAANFDQTGYSVSGTGDMNGDGRADLIIGSRLADPVSGLADGDEGSSTIIFGGTANLASLDALDLSIDGRIDLAGIPEGQGFQLNGSTAFPYDMSGYSVAGAGDVNGDGYADALIGALNADRAGADNNEGAAYLIFGRAAASFTKASLSLASLNGQNGVRFDGLGALDRAGRAVNTAGDMNADGIADLVIGAPSANPNGANSGSTYVVFGHSTWAASYDLSALNGVNGFRIDGANPDDLTGVAVSNMGDVNGDGYGDLLVASQGFDHGAALEAGAAYIIFGKATGFAATINVADLDGNTGFRIEGVVADGIFGRGVVGPAGDVNHDGFDDILAGAARDSFSGDDSGASYVIYGHRADSAVNRIGTAIANVINGGFGDDTIAGLGGGDTLKGWEGHDAIDGGNGHDTLLGGVGNDVLNGGRGADVINGESGLDTASYAGSSALIRLALDGSFAAAGEAALDTLLSIENIIGTSFGDVLRGNAGANRIDGGKQNDRLSGEGGNDTLIGGLGSDRLDGGSGADWLDGGGANDRLTGGLGFDRFHFGAAAGSDVVLDFTDDVDTLVIDSSYGFADAAAVVAATVQAGDYARIILGGGSQIYLTGFLTAGGGHTIASLLNDIVIG